MPRTAGKTEREPDLRIDAYIDKSAAFAKPILRHLRTVVHDACPEVEESIKWGMPCFNYHGILCSMAAFKEHCAFGFWKASLILGPKSGDGSAAGQFGKIAKVKDLPPKTILTGYIRKAMKLNEEGVKSPTRSTDRPKKPDIPVPAYFSAALAKNRKAKAGFESFSPSHRREYLEWITEAKTQATRERRMASALEWLAEGKSRNWKYER